MGEDAIKRWHQIRLRHHARIRNLRIIGKQKENQAKCQEIRNGQSIKDVTNCVGMNCKKNLNKTMFQK